jgi:hypothetical protein
MPTPCAAGVAGCGGRIRAPRPRLTRLPFDGFVIYTDSETWAGDIHPAQALRNYRAQVRADARCVVVGMTSEGFSIADPADRGMMDVMGFDAAAGLPAIDCITAYSARIPQR